MLASSPDPTFGPFVIVQMAVAAAIGLGVALQWFRGEKAKGRSSSSGGTQIFFDGPLVKALDILQGIYRIMDEMRTENKETVTEFRARHEEELNILRVISEAARLSAKRDDNADARRRRRIDP